MWPEGEELTLIILAHNAENDEGFKVRHDLTPLRRREQPPEFLERARRLEKRRADYLKLRDDVVGLGPRGRPRRARDSSGRNP